MNTRCANGDEQSQRATLGQCYRPLPTGSKPQIFTNEVERSGTGVPPVCFKREPGRGEGKFNHEETGPLVQGNKRQGNGFYSSAVYSPANFGCSINQHQYRRLLGRFSRKRTQRSQRNFSVFLAFSCGKKFANQNQNGGINLSLLTSSPTSLVEI